MEKNNSNMWVGVVGIVIVAGILFFVLSNKQEVASPVTENPANTEIESEQDVSETTGVGVTSISYANALVKYADRRIQLDTACQAHPNTVTYKDNTGIMIDNRSPKTRTVKVNSTFTIKPYGFKIVVLPNISTLPKTLLVDCDQSQNVATILVQE